MEISETLTFITTYWYWLACGVVMLLSGISYYRWTRRAEKKRQKRLRTDADFSGVSSISDFMPNVTQARERAQKSLRLRFSIVRISGLLFIILVAVGGFLVPFRNALPTQFISIIIAGATVSLGIVTKPFIENLIAGVIITFSGQLRTGDTILIQDMYGTVENISPTHTTIKVWDWRRFIISNTQMMQTEFINYSVVDNFIWSHAEFWVSPDSDLEKVETLAKEAALESEYRIAKEAVDFWIMGAEKDAVKCWIAGWTDDPGKAWNFKADVLKRTLHKLHKAQIKTQRLSIETAGTQYP